MVAGTVFAVGLAVSLSAGCGKIGGHDDPPISSVVSVQMGTDSTDGQRSAVEAKLRSLPSVKSVKYLSPDEAYQQYEEEFERENGTPSGMKGLVPGTFAVEVSDGKLIEPIAAVVRRMPAVLRVHDDVSGGLVDPKAGRGVVVRLTERATDADRADLEQKIRAIAHAQPPKFESAADAYKRLKKRCEGLTPDSSWATYRFTVTYDGANVKDVQALSLAKGTDGLLFLPAWAL
jgi:cell division protein FtsX